MQILGGKKMKYDLSKKPTRGAQRTLDAFSTTMFHLLAKKSFEEISVQEICEFSNFPRATFYNYFDDKYDLVNYCWYVLGSQLHLEERLDMNPEETLTIFFDRIYDLFSKKNELLSNILRYNPLNGYLVHNFNTYFKKIMRENFYECLDNKKYNLPVEIIADHYSNTILLLLEWVFLKQQETTQEQIQQYLDYLLGDL